MGFNEFLTKLFGNKSQRDLKEITPYVEKVKAVYPSIKELSNDEPVQHLGFKALYQIATIPEDKREEKHKTSSGEMKNSYEMTTKEREDFKRHQRKLELEKSQLESQLEQAQHSESIAHKQLEKFISIHNIYRR